MATGREKKRKRFSFSDNATKINRIKVALAEVIADTDPKDAKTSENSWTPDDSPCGYRDSQQSSAWQWTNAQDTD